MPVKPWWQSQTIYSDILTVIMAVLPQIDSVFGTHIVANPLYSVALTILAAVGIHGRITATTQIGSK